ncbi:hypothetical protein N7523_006711 [Penicillium sp. IBT 18751x]|nr:hypothetical protein N7523_006711 [Penicillium sp. IBT 18751x]
MKDHAEDPRRQERVLRRIQDHVGDRTPARDIEDMHDIGSRNDRLEKYEGAEDMGVRPQHDA